MKGIDWRFKKALKRLVLVCMAGFSFYQAVALVLEAIETTKDDDDHDEGEESPKPLPEGGLKAEWGNDLAQVSVNGSSAATVVKAVVGS